MYSFTYIGYIIRITLMFNFKNANNFTKNYYFLKGKLEIYLVNSTVNI